MLTVNRICVIGLGYVGLPNAVVFASRGYDFVGVDVDDKKVGSVNGGSCYRESLGWMFFCAMWCQRGLRGLRALRFMVFKMRSERI